MVGEYTLFKRASFAPAGAGGCPRSTPTGLPPWLQSGAQFGAKDAGGQRSFGGYTWSDSVVGASFMQRKNARPSRPSASLVRALKVGGRVTFKVGRRKIQGLIVEDR